MRSLQSKKELILEAELDFTRSIARALFEKPTVSFWMILIPVLLVYFIYRMKKYQNGRRRFEAEFMLTRRKAVDLAAQSETFDRPPRIDDCVQSAGLSAELAEPYRRLLSTLVAYHRTLLSADGDDYEELIRAAFPRRADFLDAIHNIGAAEKAFHDALRPGLRATPGALEIIAVIEDRARRLRLQAAEALYAPCTVAEK